MGKSILYLAIISFIIVFVVPVLGIQTNDEIRISKILGDKFTIRAGSNENITNDAIFRIVRNDMIIGSAKVIALRANVSVLQVTNSEKPFKVGDLLLQEDNTFSAEEEALLKATENDYGNIHNSEPKAIASASQNQNKFAVFQQQNKSLMRFRLYCGASRPQGDFSSVVGSKAGYAKNGFCAIIEGSKKISKGIGWMSSVSLSLNDIDERSFKKSLERSIEQKLEILDILYPNEIHSAKLEVEIDKYITLWTMTGLSFETIASPSIKIYGLGQVGLLFSRFPDIIVTIDIESKNRMTNIGTTFTESLNQTTKMSTTFAPAYCVGVGVIINNEINLGIRYFNGEPEYTHTINGIDEPIVNRTKMPATVLQLLFGINF